MINGITRSQMDMRNTSMMIHYTQLTKIVNSPYRSISSFDKNFANMVRKKRFNHLKWKNFNQNCNFYELFQKVSHKFKSKIKEINKNCLRSVILKLNYQQNQDKYSFFIIHIFRVHVHFQNLIIFINGKDWRLQQIDKIHKQQNEYQKAAGPLNHKKDFQSYKKSRSIVKRLQNFPVIKRLQINVQSHRRKYKTQEKLQRYQLITPKSKIFNAQMGSFQF